MSLSKKSPKYFKPWRRDRIPYKSWKQYRQHQKHGMLERDSFVNHLPLEGIMLSTYKFTCAADPSKNFEMVVSEDMDVTGYVDAMVKTGFKVEGPDNIIHTVNGATIVEPKMWSEKTIECGYCGDTMDLVSIEDGYSCRNKDCELHLVKA